MVAKPLGILLYPLDSFEELREDDVLYAVTSVNPQGEIEHELRTEANESGGVCNCCSVGPSIEEAKRDPSCRVQAYRYEVLDSSSNEQLLEAWRKEQARREALKIAAQERARQAVRERGTPVLDKLKAKKVERKKP